MKEGFYDEIITAMARQLSDGFHYPSHEQIIQELKLADDPVLMIADALSDTELPAE